MGGQTVSPAVAAGWPIMKTPSLFLVVVLFLGFLSCRTAATKIDPKIDKDLSTQISAILAECQKIKPGMTRAELDKVFTTEGGLSTAQRRTFVYRGCPYIKVDVDFSLSDPRQTALEERPTDIISKISKPYLDWSIGD